MGVVVKINLRRREFFFPRVGLPWSVLICVVFVLVAFAFSLPFCRDACSVAIGFGNTASSSHGVFFRTSPALEFMFRSAHWHHVLTIGRLCARMFLLPVPCTNVSEWWMPVHWAMPQLLFFLFFVFCSVAPFVLSTFLWKAYRSIIGTSAVSYTHLTLPTKA